MNIKLSQMDARLLASMLRRERSRVMSLQATGKFSDQSIALDLGRITKLNNALADATTEDMVEELFRHIDRPEYLK